ncbi:MAG: hypothetical protein NC397_01955 [Clostridium sp.]|nr:hypothetical protein [Clostridium sp.]
MKINIGENDICYTCKKGNQVECDAGIDDVFMDDIGYICDCKCYKARTIDYKGIADAFNSICTSLPKIRALTDTRKTHLNTLVNFLKKYDLSVEEYFKRVQESDYLSGRNGKWANCSFDWLIKRENILKVCENNYANKEVTNKNKLHGTATYDLDDYNKWSAENTEIG